jgi:hypothetical protein
MLPFTCTSLATFLWMSTDQNHPYRLYLSCCQVVSKRHYPDLDITDLTLVNGLKVPVKHITLPTQLAW